MPPYTRSLLITFPSPMMAFKTYKGDVPMSPNMIPKVTNTPAADIRLSLCASKKNMIKCSNVVYNIGIIRAQLYKIVTEYKNGFYKNHYLWIC